LESLIILQLCAGIINVQLLNQMLDYGTEKIVVVRFIWYNRTSSYLL